jgi:post-segregation antitoxin (ccd killing protein)
VTRRHTACRVVDVDGSPVVVRGDRDLTETDRAALTELVRAVQAQIDAEPVEVQVARQQRQAEGRARLSRFRAKLEGP